MWRWSLDTLPAIRQHGNVLFATLLLVFVLTLMGVGIVYVANSQINLVASQENKMLGMASAESCVSEARAWLQTQVATALPTTPQTISRSTLGQAGVDSPQAMNKLPGYQCSIEPLGQVGAAAASGIGAEVGDSGTYGASGSGHTYYFRVTSMGQRAAVSLLTVEVILSVTQ